jgi:hypothetical protein
MRARLPFWLLSFPSNGSGPKRTNHYDANPNTGFKVLDGYDAGVFTHRAAATYFFVGANLPEDAVYPNTTKGADGKPLTGDNKYVLRFSKDQMPPVNNFWSLTMYDKDGYLVENPINRQSISDRSKTKLGDDGSLTVYLQADSPGKDKEDNWLPCPKEGQFKVYLRLYEPKKEVINGAWKPPAGS